MIPARADELAGCRLAAGDGGTLLDGLAIDSRAVDDGDLFVAIRGGHAHTDEARHAGARAVLVDDAHAAGETGVVLAAHDTIAALQAIGAENAARASRCLVVAVTGSSGKTSTKDALAALVGSQLRTVAALEGHNNEIGLPFTLTRIAPQTDVCICELAMRGHGQIDELAQLARPHIGVITNVGEAHIGLLGSREAIAAAKAELIAALPAGDGVAVVPDDEPLLTPYLRDDVETLRFGETGAADVRLRALLVLQHGMRIRYDVAGTRVVVETNLVGRHHARNLAAALAVCRALGLDLDECAEAARLIPLQRWRGEEHPLAEGGVVVNDAYNANPASMEAALAALVARPGGGRAVAVLGEMGELGGHAPALHRRVGEAAARLGIDVIVAVGPLARHYLDGAAGVAEPHWLESADGLVDYLATIVRDSDRVLVKASRAIGLEEVAAGLAAASSNGDLR